MYLLFVFPESPVGDPAGGMDDFQGYFETTWVARQHTESMLWYEGSKAQVIEVDAGLKTERVGYGNVAEYPVLESLTVILEGQRLGHHEGSHWEWKKVRMHYPVRPKVRMRRPATKEQIEHRGRDAPLGSSRPASQKAVEDFLERNPAFHAALKGVAPSLFGESGSEDL